MGGHLRFHMMFRDGVYVERAYGFVGFRWVKAPNWSIWVSLASSLVREDRRLILRAMIRRSAT